MSAHFFKRLLTANVIGLTLVALALLVFVDGISASLRDTESTSLYWVGGAALVIGWMVGKGNSKAVPATAGIAAGGLGGVWVLGAGLSVPMIHLVREGIALIPQVVAYLRFKADIELAPLHKTWLIILESSNALASRFQTWLMGFHQNVDVNDALIRNLIWLFGMWLSAAWMGWHAARRNAMLTMLAPLTTLALVTSYSGLKTGALWGLTIVSLLLLGVWNYKSHTQRWEARQVDYSDSIIYDSTQAILVTVFLVGVLAYFTPSITLREVREYWRTRNDAANALGITENSGPPEIFSVQQPALPREHLLRGGAANSDQIVMTISTGELSPRVSAEVAARAPRYYWRSVIYDRYVGAGWVTSTSNEQTIAANSPLIPGLLKEYRSVRLNVHMQEAEGKIFWTGILYRADIPLTVEWRLKPTSSLLADQSALLQADIFAAPTNARAYTVEAYLPDVTLDELRAASTNYPEEIRKRYLDLPLSVPERVLALAKEVTANIDNPYDKAKAIEAYLRTTYPYDLNVPAPPPGRDVVDYFLFDLQKGYCDYYATAMVILARANGLPTRFVSGYAPGEYDAPNAQYIIRELHAHSWAEVYFPEIGWVEFEPTASIPEIVRGASGSIPLPAEEEVTPAPRNSFSLRITRPEFLIIPILILLGAIIFYYTRLEKRMYMRLAPSMAIEQIYQQLYRAGRPLIGERVHGETALEFADKLNRSIRALTSSRYEKNQLILHAEINILTDVHYSVLFRDQHITPNDFHTAWTSWTRIR